MDLDHFKAVNDTYGHLAGDRALAAAVHYVMEHLRPYDRVFRYGGEEFLVAMQNTDLQTGHAVIDRLREGLAGVVLAHDGARPIVVTASFGITLLDPDVSVEESIDRADKAMYAAKTDGRNRTRVWDPSMTMGR
jgi:diguanylate cyclase (GGDEF)-like protein